MNFATITAAQVCNAAIVSLSILWLFLVIDGLAGSAIACWKDATPKPQAAAPEPEAAPAYHYACPLTCGLPTPEVIVEATQEPTQAVQAEEAVEQILNPIERRLSKTVIAKMKKEQAIKLLPLWGLNPGDYKTLAAMKDALRKVVVC